MSYFISEKQIALIGRRLNAGREIGKDTKTGTDLEILYTYAQEDGLKISQEQTKKGLDWLMNLWKTPAGKERKNNPFGYREQEALESFQYFTYDGHINAGTYSTWYAPLYTVVGKDCTFQYYVSGGQPQIVG